MFAGPNGSGKSTIRGVLPAELRGVYINPDDIQRQMNSSAGVQLSDFQVRTSAEEIKTFLRASPLIRAARLEESLDAFEVRDGNLIVRDAASNAYHASALADFLRRELITQRESFSFETVMSSRDKVDLLKLAQDSGFRTYLYYVATEDPEINVSRVRNRVAGGGHDVPEEKIRSRYIRSLDLLFDAIGFTNRAYIFDNSGGPDDLLWIAEVTDGEILEMKSDVMPFWFKQAVWDKLQSPPPFS